MTHTLSAARYFFSKPIFRSSYCFNARLVSTSISRRMSLLHDGLPLTGYQFSKRNEATQIDKPSGDGSPVKVTLRELKLSLAEEMGVNHPYQQYLQGREHLKKYLPKSQEQLPKRSMQDSFLEAIIPLSQDLSLQEKYTTFLGSVRTGRLVEDMDIFTVIVARKHILIPDAPEGMFPQTLVTVLVDRIELSEYLPKPNRDIKLSGHVSWVGKSTLEVIVWLEQLDEMSKWRKITQALFLLAARDPTNTHAAIVNPLMPASAGERAILSSGEERKKRRLLVGSEHVSKKVPNTEEQKILHDIYIKTTDPTDISMSKRVLPPQAVWMSSTKVSNVILAHPEDRNLHNKVFGGFLLRHATELSWIATHMFCKYTPRTRSMSDVSFKHPIAVNSLIQMHATVVYSYRNFIQTLVFAQVHNPLSGLTSTTNTFHFTLEAPDLVPEIVPQTYYEAMLYVDGRRHFQKDLKETEGTMRLASKL